MICTHFSNLKTATKEQLGAKYLMEDIKSLFQGKSIERNHSLKNIVAYGNKLIYQDNRPFQPN